MTLVTERKLNPKLITMQKLLTLLVTVLHPIFGTRYTRNGATFLEDVDISVGYAQWVVISGLDSEYIQDDFIVLSEMKQTLFNYIEQYGTIETDIDFTESFWKLQISSLEDVEQKAKSRYQDLNIYLGTVEKTHEKRSAGAAVAGTLEFAAKIGSAIYDIQNANKKSDKLSQFIKRYNLHLRNLNSTVEELFSYKEEQVSFNRKVLNQLFALEEKFSDLNEELEKLNYGITSKLVLQYHFTFLREAYISLTKFQDNLLNGLIKASRGIPSAPFLLPNNVLQIMTDYQDEQTEKSYFNTAQVLEVYNLATTRLEKDDNEVAVVSTVKLPTTNTKARLLKLVTYPVFNQQNQTFVTIKPKFPYIAINAQSQYMLLSTSDINSCQKSQNIYLCESTDTMVWTDRDIASCESSIWFQDQDEMEALCNYVVESNDDEARLTHIQSGTYHFSVPEELSVPIECSIDGIQKSENLELRENGFLVISPSCSATIQGTTIRNLLPQNVERFNITQDLSFHNVAKISHLKNETLREALEESELYESLNNEDIIEHILDARRHANDSITIKKLFETYAQTAKEAAALKISQEQATQSRLEKLLKNDVEAITSYKILDIVIITLAILIALIFLAAFFFVYWFLKVRSTSQASQVQSPA